MIGLNSTPQDWNVSNKVRIALKVHRETEQYAKCLRIGASEGVVHLLGEVPSEQIRHAIDKVANDVPDVIFVVDEMRVTH